MNAVTREIRGNQHFRRLRGAHIGIDDLRVAPDPRRTTISGPLRTAQLCLASSNAHLLHLHNFAVVNRTAVLAPLNPHA
jgi:hypothetical protein